MATFEQVGIAFQIVNNVFGLVGNMRDNAEAYKAQAALPGADLARIAEVMRADAGEYVRRVGWISALAQRNNTLFSAALGVFSITMPEANSFRNTLLSVANHTISATLNTQANINTESDLILANTPNLDRLW